MSYLDDVNQKRQSQSDQRLMQAALLGNRQKPSIILTDSTDLGEHISKLGNKIVDVLEAVKDDKNTSEQIDLLTNLTIQFRKLVETVNKAGEDQANRIADALHELAITQRNQKPIVVPAPAVTLTEKDVDFKPVIKAIERLMKPVVAGFDLAKYRAHDLQDAPDGQQYIGFINPDGDWYIMQHDPSSNRDRYYFGAGSYEEAWDEKHIHEYRTISEARHALSA